MLQGFSIGVGIAVGVCICFFGIALGTLFIGFIVDKVTKS